MKIKGREQAVTEIIGAMILLCMAIAVFAVIYSNVLSDEGPSPETFVTVIGYTETIQIGNQDPLTDVIFRHQQGENIALDSKVIITIAGKPIDEDPMYVHELLDDSLENDGWNIGEPLIYHSGENLIDVEIKAYVFDKDSDSMIFWGTLQEGYIVPPFGMGGIWHFDEDSTVWTSEQTDGVLDSSGNGNHGTAKGGATTITDAKSGRSGSFDSAYYNFVEVIPKFPYSLNINDKITVEAWMKPLEEKYIRHTSDFNARFSYNPKIIHISGDIYAIVGEGQDAQEGVVSTLKIEKDGTISKIDENNVSFDDERWGLQPDIIEVSSDGDFKYYVISYSGKNNVGYLKLIKISSTDGSIDGLFNEAPKVPFDINKGCWPNVIKIDTDVFAIVYSDQKKSNQLGNGYLETFKINPANGAITILPVKWNFDNKCNEPSIIHVSDDLYTIIYRGNNDAGIIKTVRISADGLTITPEKSRTFSNVGWSPDIVHISNDIYAIAYRGKKGVGFVETVKIDTFDGSITTLEINNIFDNNCFSPDIIHILGNMYGVVYSDAGSGLPDGRIARFEITPDGNSITNIEVILYQMENIYTGQVYSCITPRIIQVSDLVFAVAYMTGSQGGPPHYGLVSTFKLGEDPTSPWNRGIFKYGSINIYCNETKVFASLITEDNSEYHLSLEGITPDNWYHIVLTFDGLKIRLYCNKENTVFTKSPTTYYELSLASPTPKTIKIPNISKLYFGYLFYGYIDEVAIHNEVLIDNDPTSPSSIQYHFYNLGFFENET